MNVVKLLSPLEPTLELDPSTCTDLPMLLGGDSPLIQALACSSDYTASLKCLRLVSKEVGRLALLGLREYTLSLQGNGDDTNVNAASLLQHAKLSKLTVHLRLTGSYSPAILLRGFMQEVGSALDTVSNLDLYIEDTCSSSVTPAVLGQAVAALIIKCPALLALRYSKDFLPMVFMQNLRDACPLLTTLELWGRGQDRVHMQQLLHTQPVLFPQISKLIFGACNYSLPDMDMSHNTSVLTLVLDGWYFRSASHWLCLPPNLQMLEYLNDIDVGPPITLADGTASLPTLLSCTVGEESVTYVDVLAQLLRAAPSLCAIQSKGNPEIAQILIEPSLTAAADLVFVHGRMDLELVRNAAFRFNSGPWDQASHLSFIAYLPRLTGITRCQIVYSSATYLQPLLAAFPDVKELYLLECKGLEDLGLCDVASCRQLLKLRLFAQPCLTPVGVLALCLRLPALRSISCERCDQLTPLSMAPYLQLLKGYNDSVDANVVID